MARIFVSHSSTNNAQAVALVDWLAVHGWGRDDIFLDIDPASGISPGERWQKALNEAAGRCEAVLFLISRDWLSSRWCMEELSLAHKLNKRLFGVLIDTVSIKEVPARLRDEWQLIDLESGRDGARFDVELPGGQRGFATLSASGLDRLRAGLVKAGLDPRHFDWPPVEDPDRAPYRGLAPMEAEDAGIFYGREAATIAALDQLRGLAEAAPPRLMTVLGASGAGKSSFMRAGLIPRLLRDDRNFLVLPIVRPERAALSGRSGLAASIEAAARVLGLKWTKANLVTAISGGADEVAALLTELASSATVRITGMQEASLPAILLPVDQAEELFLAEGREEAQALLSLLAALLNFQVPRVIMLVTIRTDSYEQLQNAPALANLGQLPFNLPALARGSYQRVIEGPAERLAGSARALRIEPALTAALLADIEEGGAKDALPLLAFTLERLFVDHGSDGDLTLAEYEESGRIAGAIETAVERALAAADNDTGVPRDRVARLALLRRAMIPWLAGIDPETKTARRKVAHLTDIPDEARPLIRHFVEQRLLSTDVSRETGESTIEPAHEALLRQWGLIDRWLKEDIAVLGILEGVRRAARDWDANRRDANWLAHAAGRLDDAESIKSRTDLARRLDGTDLAYLEAAKAVDTARRDREVEEARKLSEARKLAAQRTRMGAIAALLFAVAAGIFGWYGLEQADSATKQKAVAVAAAAEAKKNETVSLAALSRVARSENLPVAAVKLALAAWPRGGDESRPALLRTIDSLGAELADLRERLSLQVQEDWVNCAAFSPDGSRIVTASYDKTARVWDAATGTLLLTLAGHEGGINSAAFSPDGTRIVTASDDDTARVWDAATGAALVTLTGHEYLVNSAAFSPDGTRIVTASSDRSARVWDTATGNVLVTLTGHEAAVSSASFSPDGTRIVTTSDDTTARIWDAAFGTVLLTLTGHDEAVSSASFSSDGGRVVTGSDDKTARVWDAETGTMLLTLTGHTSLVKSSGFSPDGTRIVTASYDKTARVWDAATGTLLLTLAGHEGGINSAAFSPDGRHIVTASFDKTARIWDAAGTSAVRLTGHEDFVNWATFSPDGTRILTASSDKTSRVWDLNGVVLVTLRRHEGSVYSAAFSPDSARIVDASSDDDTARVWDAATGIALLTLTGHQGLVSSVVFSPDGTRIATASDDRTTRVWSAGTGTPLLTLKGHKDSVNSVAFSPDGARIVTASVDLTARVWDTTGVALLTLTGHAGALNSAAFSPDGTRIVTASNDNTARVWDAATGVTLLTLAGHEGSVNSAAFSPDGTRIVTASDDLTARVWDAATGAALLTLTGHEASVRSAVFSPDGQRILTASYDKTARVWDITSLEKGDAFQVACQRLGSDIDLSDVEARYGLSKLPPICGDHPPLPVDLHKVR